MSKLLEFTIEERIYPYVRMTQRGKFSDPAALAYMHNQKVIKYILKSNMLYRNWELFDHQPLGCDLLFELTQVHKADLDNLIKAVLDAGTGIIYTSDAWIDTISARRRKSDAPKTIMQFWTL